MTHPISDPLGELLAMPGESQDMEDITKKLKYCRSFKSCQFTLIMIFIPLLTQYNHDYLPCQSNLILTHSLVSPS
jgi:hypothetical protein